MREFFSQFEVVFLGMRVNWLAQIFGIGLLIFSVTSYLQKDKKGLLTFMAIGFLFAICQFFILFAWTGLIKASLGLVRNCIMLVLISKGRETPFWVLAIFMTLSVVFSAFFIVSWYAILPVLQTVIFTIALGFKNFYYLKTFSLLVETLGFIYSFIVGAYIGCFSQMFILIAIVISIIKFNGNETKAEAKIMDE